MDLRRLMKSRAALMSITLLIAVLVISSAEAEAKSSSSLKLEALCRNSKVTLYTLDQVRILSGQIDSVGADCPDIVRAALLDLIKLTQRQPNGVCTMAHAQAITQFVDTYIRRSFDGAEAEDKLPEPLEKFAIAYGMKVSGICGRKMITGFGVKAKRELELDKPVWELFKKEIDSLRSDLSPISKILDPIIKTGEFILPIDLMQAIPGMADHVSLLVPRDSSWIKLKHLCTRVFQPLYEPVLFPLAHLIRNGFNNRDFYWQRKFRRSGRFWSRAVFMCEAMKTVEADPQQGIGPEDEAEIASELGLAIAVILDDPDLLQKDESSYITMDTRPNHIGSKIYGRFDFSMKSLVRNFDANKNHVDLLRERIFGRSFRMFRKLFKSRGFRAVLLKILDKMKARRGSEADLERAKNELVSLMEAPERNSLSYNIFVGIPKFIKDTIIGIVWAVLLLIPVCMDRDTPNLSTSIKNSLIRFAQDWLHVF